jgi:hypothetical protein
MQSVDECTTPCQELSPEKKKKPGIWQTRANRSALLQHRPVTCSDAAVMISSVTLMCQICSNCEWFDACITGRIRKRAKKMDKYITIESQMPEFQNLKTYL